MSESFFSSISPIFVTSALAKFCGICFGFHVVIDLLKFLQAIAQLETIEEISTLSEKAKTIVQSVAYGDSI